MAKTKKYSDIIQEMEYKIRKIDASKFPPQLLEIPEPPKELYCLGELPDKDAIYLSIVGSRKHTNYGKEACQKIVQGLKGFPIVIVSGLALGIDSIAHRTAIETGLKTMALPGSGLSESALYPRSNLKLAKEILANGGTLISEYEPNFKATLWSFPRRNRIMAGFSKAVLVIEAQDRSGTLITSRLATEYNRDVLALPGSIFSDSSKGTHMLIRLGATPVRNSYDVLEALGFKVEEHNEEEKQKEYALLTKDELRIINALNEPLVKDELIERSGLPTMQANALISLLEIKGLIHETMGEFRKL